MRKENAKIQRVELSCYDVPLHCPFCGHLAFIAEDDQVTEVTPCKHMLFMAHDEGFEFRSKLFDEIKEISGIDHDDIDLGEQGYDGFTDDVILDNSIKFAIYIPAPSFFGAYFGFAENISQ